MKLAIVIVAAFLVWEASCSVVPQQSVKGSSDDNLARVKRCACGPYGCLCRLRDDDLVHVQNVENERVKRSAKAEPEQTLEQDGNFRNLERVKRGVACGPKGCIRTGGSGIGCGPYGCGPV